MKILPDLQTLGSLNPHTLVLELPTISRATLEASLAEGRNLEPARIFAHELHHWLDIVGTPWGQEYIDTLFAAYESLEVEKSVEYTYHRALKLFDSDRAILFPSYFKYVAPGAARPTPEDRWRMNFTAGSSFHLDGRLDEDSPILFVRFSQEQREVSRQPLTIGTLLELRALAAELLAFETLSADMDRNEGLVERHIFLNGLVHSLYEPELTTYSAAAHVLSFGSGVPHPVDVVSFGAKVSDICLNLTHGATRKLNPADGLDPGPRGLYGFRSKCNRPYVFACLSFFLGKAAANPLSGTSLATALAAAKLPSEDLIYQQYGRAMKQPARPLKVEWLKRIRDALHEAGVAISQDRLDYHGVFPPFTWKDLPSPFTMTCDGEEFHMAKPTISVEDSYRLHEASASLAQVTRQALRAARGLDFRFTDFVY